VKAHYVTIIKKNTTKNHPDPIGKFCQGCNYKACWCWTEKEDKVVCNKKVKIIYTSRFNK